ncbi:MAG: PLP-dependent aminotransferase family protein [Anaerolineae bacterium]|jgi:DNA-binding transcriptional MocR family regulator|nr:PLP-dependent aminotransferase family protein [Anaerolineae bacterium]
MLNMPVDVDNTKPIYLQIADHITALAQSGQLGAGFRLPPSRALAEQLTVHRSTIVNAYEELKARGVVEARQGSGSTIASGLQVHTSAPMRPTVPYSDHPQHLMNVMWDTNRVEGMLSLSLGAPADELMPVDDFEAMRARALRRDRARAYNYEDPAGHEPLRRAIASDLGRHGVLVSPDDVVVTFGAGDALTMAARLFGRSDDPILTEAPAYFSSVLNLKRMGYEVLGFKLGAEGPDWDDLAGVLRGTQMASPQARLRRPRFVMVNPDHQNPTGLHWAMGERHRFMRLASEMDMQIIEDGAYRDLTYDGSPLVPLRALDPSVLYIGTFSKTLMPGLRIGYVVASGPLREQFITLRRIASCGGSGVTERALAAFITNGMYEAHLERIRGEYRVRRDAMCEAMQHYFPPEVQWRVPNGGFFMWVRLPEHVPAMELFRMLMERGIVIAPGSLFYPSEDNPQNAIRMSFARYNPDTLRYAVKKIGECIVSLLRHPLPSIS